MPSEQPSARPPPPRVTRRVTLGRPLLFLLGLGTGVAVATGYSTPSAARRERSASTAATIALAARGYHAEPDAVHWVDPPHERRGWLFDEHRFVFIGRRSAEPDDVWLGSAQLSPEGRFIQLTSLYNLSDTSAVSESNLTVSGQRIAWSVSNGQEVVSVHVGDLSGQELPQGAGMTALERWQTRITNLQETGQLRGLCRRVFRFASPRPKVSLVFTDAGLHVESGDQSGLLRCDDRAPESLDVAVEPSEIGSPGDLITWTVDRVRALPWFGTDRMQWVKAVAFGAWERFDAVKRRVVKTEASAALADEVGDLLSEATTRAPDPATGWPPAPMTPILTPTIPGEGSFRPLDEDPFAVPPWGGPSPFAFAFIRPDATRQESRIFVTLWDPRRVELHTMTGTREPKTATGETGSGTVPRNPDVIGRLAGAFNGGFQATHGEFGMMAQGIVYLPPKPYAATIVERTDGTLGMGTWPNDDSIPDGTVGFRQNLTPLVADDAVNPYGRTWWGGVPPGWEDATRTVRTGLCLTKDDFVAYFYGSSISADHLASAMVSARCSYGIHLDMNPGHTGFEFYRVAPAGNLPKIQHRLEPTWEARGEVPGAPGWEFIGRRMLKTMHLMHFPRYVRTDSRDFFYLTHRYILPPRACGTKTPYVWQIREHEQQGFPPAIATARIRPDDARPELELSVTILDGKWLVPCVSNCPDTPAIARMERTRGGSGLGVYYHQRQYVIADSPPSAAAVPIAFGKDESTAGKSAAALGIAHGDWLLYAEVTRGADRQRDATHLKQVLSELGANKLLFLDQSLEVTVGDKAHARRGGLTWQRDTSPMATRVFQDTAVVKPAIWQPLQNKRVRYLRPAAQVSDPRTSSQRAGADGRSPPAAAQPPSAVQPTAAAPTGDPQSAP